MTAGLRHATIHRDAVEHLITTPRRCHANRPHSQTPAAANRTSTRHQVL
jgi:hypothetical protein